MMQTSETWGFCNRGWTDFSAYRRATRRSPTGPGLFTLSPQPLDLAALAHEYAESFAAPGRTAVRLDAPPELHVIADPARLRQVLDNLLANAEQHSPDGAPVTLGAAAELRDGENW